MMFGSGYGMGWMWLWVLLAIIGLLLLIFVVVRIASGGFTPRDLSGTHPGDAGAPMRSTPRQILDERYAKGELTTKEYRERISALGESSLNQDG